MQTFLIRKATLDDMEQLLRFQQGVVEAERPFDITLKEGNLQYYDLVELIAASNSALLVAVYGQQVIGSGYAQIKKAKDYLRHEQYAYLGFMFVLPEFRRQGVNQLLIQALKKWSKAQNVTELRLEVYADNYGAIKAYEKEGFAKHMIEMRIDLEKGSRNDEKIS